MNTITVGTNTFIHKKRDHAIFEIVKAGEKEQDRPYHAAAKIYQLLATRHYFNDGNKRTSHILAKILLLSYQIYLEVRYANSINFIIEIADKQKTVDQIQEWIKNNSRYMNKIDNFIEEMDKEFAEMKKWKEEHHD
ncbi:Fic family protein [archaeon]|nr:Fic family protein [archaeon]